MTLKEAYNLCLSKKPNIGPNKSFFEQLMVYEKSILGSNSLNLRDYLANQLSNGAASSFSLAQINRALDLSKNDPNKALNILFS
jgi:hypothetical protein